jgi:stage V sporulation protein D (sporulation-specific penicillin-binding protein)
MFYKFKHRRIKTLLVVLCFLFLLIICKVFYIQVIDYSKLNTLANNLWSRNLPIEADRGIIYDRNGEVLAENLTTIGLILIPNQIKNKEEVAKNLASILNTSYEEMYKHVSKKVSIERVHPEGRRLDFEVADKINALGYEGVYLVKESKRHYGYGNYLSHVLGYVGIDNQGLSGLELQYDKYLTGAYGAIKYFSDAKGNRLKLSEVYEQPQNGVNIMLTINNDIQKSVERELNNVVNKYNPDSTLAIVMDPNTGEILGMSAKPDFDPNNYQNYSEEVINRNLPIWATYEPGSTFKVVTLSAALNEGVVDLEKDTFYDAGYRIVAGSRIRCWKAGGHGQQTFLEVVENSCNPGFMELGDRLGKEVLFKYIDLFGFGKKTGIDLNGEGNGIIFDLEKVGPLELATTSFGQGVSVTPIQQITAVSAAINGGNLYQPYIVKALLEPETNIIIKENKPQLKKQVITTQTSAKVRYALESVVSNGTGRNAYIEGYRVGGKTGTAQKLKDGRYMVGNYILSFMGFAPADDPKVVVYVAIDNPKGVVQYGGVVAAPIAKNIISDCMGILGIEKRKGGMEKEYQWFDKKYYDVPDVVGLKIKEAMELLGHFQVEFSGSGDRVIKQSPEAGNRLTEGSKIRLLIGN